ncbi:MAG TPA: YecA family protein [Leucothrix sp.]|nr:YecA family protein [Leucothrix sp.]
MDKMLDYFKLENALRKAEADYSASEAQAIACGMLAVNIAADKITWVQLIFGEINSEDTLQVEAIKLTGELHDQCKRQLQDANLAFELLMPNEEESLLLRVSALQEWCNGFLLGIGLSGISDHKTLPEDTRELLVDFTEIGTSGSFDLEDEEASEEALAEISEYVRMGVLLINEELQPIKQSTLIH